MITWLPQFGYAASAKRLDDDRLIRQIDMCHQIMELLQDAEEPMLEEVRMWYGYEQSFCLYSLVMVNEAVTKRHVRQGIDSRPFHEYMSELRDAQMGGPKPVWGRDVNIARSHRSRLISLDPAHYDAAFPNTPPNMPVLWPQTLKADATKYRLRLKTNDIKRLHGGTRALPPWLYYNPHQNEVIVRSET